MKGWQRSVLWEGLPLLIVLLIFGLISAINWGYEGKFFEESLGGKTWLEVHQGLFLLMIALIQTLVASLILLITRIIWPKVTQGVALVIPLTLVSVFLILPSLFIVVLGPAALTMIEQTRSAPR